MHSPHVTDHADRSRGPRLSKIWPCPGGTDSPLRKNTESDCHSQIGGIWGSEGTIYWSCSHSRNPRPPTPKTKVPVITQTFKHPGVQQKLCAQVPPWPTGQHPQGKTLLFLLSQVEELQFPSEGINCKFIFEALCAVFYASLNTKT